MAERRSAAATWPPAPTEATQWRRVVLHFAAGGRREVVVRETILWGRAVLLDESDAIWCRSCHRFVDLDEVRGEPTGHAFDRRSRSIIVAFEPERAGRREVGW